MSCTCFIIPIDALERLASDPDIQEEIREIARRTARISMELHKLRDQALSLSASIKEEIGVPPAAALAKSPTISVFDCKNHHILPGLPLLHPGDCRDKTAVRACKETTAVATFFRDVFRRNSIDDRGMTMLSSIHYGSKFNNAMWNGSEMLYGDGDNQIFVDFTQGSDVIAHELTHGMTQHTLQLEYTGDAGGLNESLSDCFGSMFRQWERRQDVITADWLIGADILGPVAKTKGYTCLRNMANPADPGCIAGQPTKYSQLTPTMDPHYSSGPPNLAFCLACKSVGGMSWEKVGQVWYHAVTAFGSSPKLQMKEFANRTRQVAEQMFRSERGVAKAIDSAWKEVEL
jgi:Zn-dependent metalloprotease